MRRRHSDTMAFVRWCLLAMSVLHLETCTAHKAPNDNYISEMKHLHESLMEGYKTSIRPVNQSSETVTVDLVLFIEAIDDLDEKNQALRLSGFIRQRWQDVGLVWNATDFKDINSIKLPASELWLPDVVIRNSKNAYFDPVTHHFALLNSDGVVVWIAPINTETHCELDLSEFPFDEHVCRVIFILWSHSDLEVNLTSSDLRGNASRQLQTQAVNQNPKWELKKMTVERRERRFNCCEGGFSDIVYSYAIRRRSTFATHLFVGPSVILSIITPAVFLLPPGSGEKMMFGVGVLIADTLLLGELIDYVPTAHPNLPLIGKYFLANIVMAALSLAISAIIVGFWDKSTSRMSGPPAFFRLIFLDPIATILCVKKDDLLTADDTASIIAMEVTPGESTTESTGGVDPASMNRQHFMDKYLRNAVRSEWRQLAVVFDRLFFIIYCVILAILTLSFARYL